MSSQWNRLVKLVFPHNHKKSQDLQIDKTLICVDPEELLKQDFIQFGEVKVLNNPKPKKDELNSKKSKFEPPVYPAPEDCCGSG